MDKTKYLIAKVGRCTEDLNWIDNISNFYILALDLNVKTIIINNSILIESVKDVSSVHHISFNWQFHGRYMKPKRSFNDIVKDEDFAITEIDKAYYPINNDMVFTSDSHIHFYTDNQVSFHGFDEYGTELWTQRIPILALLGGSE